MDPNRFNQTACESIVDWEAPIRCNPSIEERLTQNALSALDKATNKPRIKEFEEKEE